MLRNPSGLFLIQGCCSAVAAVIRFCGLTCRQQHGTAQSRTVIPIPCVTSQQLAAPNDHNHQSACITLIHRLLEGDAVHLPHFNKTVQHSYMDREMPELASRTPLTNLGGLELATNG